MTYQEAKAEIGDMDTFCQLYCDSCTSSPWSCPDECQTLFKARQMGIRRITECYARHDGDMKKVDRYIKQAKL